MSPTYVPNWHTVGHWAMWGDFFGQLAASLFWISAVVVYNDYTTDMIFQLLAACSWTVACVFQLYVRLGYAHEGIKRVEAARTAAWARVHGTSSSADGVPLTAPVAGTGLRFRL